jgi:ribonuclease D
VTRPEELAACCEHLAGCTTFGLDTEFVGENTYHPQLCLVQVATGERRYLIDPFTAGPLDRFWGLVVDPAIRVVVHAGREEVRLCRRWAGRMPENICDLQLAAALIGLHYPIGHGNLVKELLGISLPKMETLTEWRDRPLTRQQIRYAFDDVRYLLPLWGKLEDQLHQLGRWDWAVEEFDRLRMTAAIEESPPEKWRKLRGLGSLDRSRLAVVRELFGWREETAGRLNRPPRSVVRDDLLIEIARRNPRKERDLSVIRGLPRRNLAAILEVVERARRLPPEQCPAAADREQDPPQLGVMTSILSAVLADFCARNRLAGSIVAGSNDLKILVRSRMQGRALPDDLLLARGWRGAHVLPTLNAVLEGRQAVRIRDVTSTAPLDYSPDGSIVPGET